MTTTERKCIVCGCTDLDACHPPCSWADENVCSACVTSDETKEMLALLKVDLRYNDLANTDNNLSDLEDEFTLILNTLKLPSIKDVCEALAKEFKCEVKYNRANGFYRTDRDNMKEYLCPTKENGATEKFAPGVPISYELAEILFKFYNSKSNR